MSGYSRLMIFGLVMWSSACSALVPVSAHPSVKAAIAYERTPCFAGLSLPQGVLEGKDVVCGYVSVPQYHTDANSKKLRLAVTVTKSTNPHPDPTPLVMAQGGPGGASINLFLYMSLGKGMAALRAQRDIVVVDYRGTGYSQPFFTCPDYTSITVQSYLENIGNYTEKGKKALSTCLSGFTQQGYDLSAFNSVEIAADYPEVIKALGYKQFHFYGVSYGTEIGQYLMREAPPGSLRSVVLDSIVPVGVNFKLTVPNSADRDFRLIFKRCAADAACQQAYPNLEKVFLSLVDTLNNAPVRLSVMVPGSGIVTVPLSGSLLVQVLYQDLYSGPFIPDVPQLVFKMAKGDYTAVQPLVSGFLALIEDPTMAQGLFTTVECADYPDVTLADYHLKGLYPQVADAMAGTDSACQVAKVKLLESAVHQPVASDIPVLALSGAFDPITPPELADIALARMRHVTHYTFPAEGHGAIFNACAVSMMTNFVANPQQKPAAACLQQQKPPAFGKAIALIPYTDADQRFSSVIPNSWQGNGNPDGGFSDFYATRNLDFSVSSGTMSVDDVVSQYGVDTSQEKVPVGQRVSHGMTWKLYRVEAASTAYVALTTQGGSSYAVMVSAPPQDMNDLVKNLFYPAIDAFQVAHRPCV